MALDEKLLNEARGLRDKLIDAQFEAERTALAYQHSIRKLHAAGGSMREVAEALGLSHQRVHQIIDEGSGKGALKEGKRRRRTKSRGVPPSCAFCGRQQADVRKLVAGPGVAICDDCVDLADAVVAARLPRASDLTSIRPVTAPKSACDFCGKTIRHVDQLVAAKDVNICNECLALCGKILRKEGDRPRR